MISLDVGFAHTLLHGLEGISITLFAPTCVSYYDTPSLVTIMELGFILWALYCLFCVSYNHKDELMSKTT